MTLKKSEKGKGKARKIDYVEIDSEKGEDKVGGASEQENIKMVGVGVRQVLMRMKRSSHQSIKAKIQLQLQDLLLSLPRLHQILDRYCVSYRRSYQLLILL